MKRCPIAGDAGASEGRKDADRWRKSNDPVNALYRKASFRVRFRTHVLHRNPICQKILRSGQQCTNPAWVVHHLISPRECPARFLDATNVVALCESCHPGGAEGTPEWRAGVDYVPSVIEPPAIG